MADDRFQGMEEELPQAPEDREQPLFIKVPGYKNILQDLEGIRQVLANMRESVEVLNHVQEVKEKSIEVFLENVQRLDQQLDDINQQFPEVHDLEVQMQQGQQMTMGEAAEEDEVIDDSVRELQDELDGLRDELDRLE